MMRLASGRQQVTRLLRLRLAHFEPQVQRLGVGFLSQSNRVDLGENAASSFKRIVDYLRPGNRQNVASPLEDALGALSLLSPEALDVRVADLQQLR
jgi:hypothetical protein